MLYGIRSQPSRRHARAMHHHSSHGPLRPGSLRSRFATLCAAHCGAMPSWPLMPLPSLCCPTLPLSTVAHHVAHCGQAHRASNVGSGQMPFFFFCYAAGFCRRRLDLAVSQLDLAGGRPNPACSSQIWQHNKKKNRWNYGRTAHSRHGRPCLATS